MDSVLRAAAVYFVILILFRLAGKRTMAEITVFDFLLLLIVSESTQQALLGNDFSMINGLLVIVTLLVLDIGMSLLKQRSATIDRWMEGTPLVLLEDGKLLEERMRRVRVDKDDILHAARMLHGLERLEQIKYAVLERSGGISIVPKE